MTQIAIDLQDVSVSYFVRHGASPTLKETVVNSFRRRSHDIEVKAIIDLTLSVEKGDIVGLIGSNGSGKSTLLKLISRVLTPTGGRIIVSGKTAPLIGLGAGFSDELTGFENILLYGSLLGRDVRELKERAPEIAKWAGLTDSLHRPIRTYSSGMLGRLAFAIAVDQAPEVLLVDEVLSVGDANFQGKSKGRMFELFNSGATVLLVSHDHVTIKEICNKVVWLERGKLVEFGDTKSVLKSYLRNIS